MSFVPVRVNTLRGDLKINFDLYIALNSKHILYIRRGDSFEGERLKRLKQKRLKKLFITPEDEEHYRQYMQTNIEAAYDSNSNQSIANRSEVIQGLQETAAEAMFEAPQDKKTYEDTKEGMKKFVDFLTKEQDAIKNLLSFENMDQSLSHHGVSVSTLSVAIAQKINYTDPKNLNLLSLGALIHDIGHMKNNSPYATPIDKLNPEELKAYQSHVIDGASMVKDLPHLDQQVIQIIAEHHETASGDGFPLKLDQKKISPMAMIVSMANAFDRLVSFEKVPKAEAVKNFTLNNIGRYPLEHLNALKEIIK